jgi:hypothetical protein
MAILGIRSEEEYAYGDWITNKRTCVVHGNPGYKK